MSLRLVVDHGLLWTPPDVVERARARNAEIHALTRPRVLAFRATKAVERSPRRGASDVEAGDDPRESVPNCVSSGRWLLAVPYLTGAAAALLGWLLVYLCGGVR